MATQRFLIWNPDSLGEMIQFDEHMFQMGCTLPNSFFNWAMKKGPPGCFGYVRDYNYTTQFCWDYENLIDHETRIPIKQPVQWKVRGVFFLWLDLNWFKLGVISLCFFGWFKGIFFYSNQRIVILVDFRSWIPTFCRFCWTNSLQEWWDYLGCFLFILGL